MVAGCSSNKQPVPIDISKVMPGDSIDQLMSQHLDSIYLSAVHTDTSLAVFKTADEQQKLITAYTEFLKEFGAFLKDHQFTWGGKTKCWNRIYFDNTGSVDYYIYDFKTPIEKEKEIRFRQLFAQYIETHPINIKANRKFAQCSPVTYIDN